MQAITKVFSDIVKPYIDSENQTLANKTTEIIQTFSKNGAHNLLPLTLENLKALNLYGTWSGNAYTLNGVTFTVNTDSNSNVTGITANGTASGGNGNITLWTPDSATENAVVLTGCPSGGSASTYSIKVEDITGGTSTYYADAGGGVSINSGRTIHSIWCAINNGFTASNIVFKPMLRLVSDSDTTYEPYAMTNRELTKLIPKRSIVTVTTDSDGMAVTSFREDDVISVMVNVAGSNYYALSRPASNDYADVFVFNNLLAPVANRTLEIVVWHR